MKYYTEEENQEQVIVEPEGCQFCWDEKRQREKILTFFDQANNLRVCNYCPWCGRKYGDIGG